MKKPIRGVEEVITKIQGLVIQTKTVRGGGELTIKNMSLQVLRKTHVRRPQSLLQLQETAPVILTLEITQNNLQRLLHLLQARVEVADLAEEVVVAVVCLDVLVGDLAHGVGGCVGDLLEAGEEVLVRGS